MFRSDYVEFAYDDYELEVDSTFDNIRLPKVVRKGKKKILFVVDSMPSEDIRSGKLLSGATGKLLETMLQVAPQYYGANISIKDFQWLAISFNAYKTAGQLEQFKQSAEQEFTERLNYIITQYKPDVVMTFGRRPAAALNHDYIQNFRGKRGIMYNHFYGVPIDTKVECEGVSHRFKHVSTLSLTVPTTLSGSGGNAYLIGYMMRNLLTALNGGKLLYRIPKMKFETEYVDTIDKFNVMMKELRRAKDVAVDTETANLNRRVNKTLIIQFATSADKAYVVPISHKDSPWRAKELDYITKSIRDLIEYRNKNKYLLFANAKFDIIRLRSDFGVRHIKADIWDVLAGEFAHDENLKVLSGMGAYFYSLLNVCMQYGNTDYYDAEFGKDQRTTIASVDMSPALIQYCALDVVCLHHIKKLQLRRAKDSRYDKYESIVGQQISDKIHMFGAMEYHGSPTDIDYLFYLQSNESPMVLHREAVVDALSKTEGVRKANIRLMKDTHTPAVGLFGRTSYSLFNVRKRKHLETLMFDVLKLKPDSVGKSGVGNIDKKFQEKYANVEEVALFNELQKISKLQSSYVKAFIKQWGVDDDMRFDRTIRPDFGYIDVVTGRSSARKPSLHQIPSRNNVTELIKKLFPGRADLGKYIKRLFIAPEGRIILKIDFAAHEVRCWSIISGDKDVAAQFQHGLNMRNHFKLFPHEGLAAKIKTEGDPHRINAAYFFTMDINDVDKAKRDSVKQVIFGLIYQQSVKGVAESTKQTVALISKLIKAFFKKFPVGAGWFEKIKSFARNHLFVESPVGRRRHLWPFLLNKDIKNAESVIAATERRAVNSPVQGQGSDFLDSGAREIEKSKWEHYEKTGHYPDFHTTNSVHDSLEFSVAYGDVWNAIRMIEHGLTEGVMQEMKARHGLEFTVPLEIDFEIGGNLRDCGAWDYSIDAKNGNGSFEHLIRETLEFQVKELGHDIDVEKVFKHITIGQYDDMPDWAKKQMWNVGKEPKKTKDPRKRKDVVGRKDLNKIYNLK